MYTSGYRRVNRRRLRTQIEDCKDDEQYTNLGTPPPVGECIRLVMPHVQKNTIVLAFLSSITLLEITLELFLALNLITC